MSRLWTCPLRGSRFCSGVHGTIYAAYRLLAKLDPHRIHQATTLLQVANDYGVRMLALRNVPIDRKFSDLRRQNLVRGLVKDFSTHSFIISRTEAKDKLRLPVHAAENHPRWQKLSAVYDEFMQSGRSIVKILQDSALDSPGAEKDGENENEKATHPGPNGPSDATVAAVQIGRQSEPPKSSSVLSTQIAALRNETGNEINEYSKSGGTCGDQRCAAVGVDDRGPDGIQFRRAERASQAAGNVRPEALRDSTTRPVAFAVEHRSARGVHASHGAVQAIESGRARASEQDRRRHLSVRSRTGSM